MDIPPELEGNLVSTPDTLSGAICFAGTRVFAFQLFSYLSAGETVEEFLDDFPGVTRPQVEAVMKWNYDRSMRELMPPGFE